MERQVDTLKVPTKYSDILFNSWIRDNRLDKIRNVSRKDITKEIFREAIQLAEHVGQEGTGVHIYVISSLTRGCDGDKCTV